MEVTELSLWIGRLLVLGLMYLFLLALIVALWLDARAARPRVATPAPAPAPGCPRRLLRPRSRSLKSSPAPPPTTGHAYSLFVPLQIGRDPDCEVSIPNRFVSSHHARLYPHEGALLIEDLGSKNGTLVNGEPVASARALAAGDRIQVGDTEFVVK